MAPQRDPDPSLQATLDTLMEGCLVVDRELRYLYLNDAAVRHARQPREKLLGRRMIECFPGIQETGFFAALDRCLQEGTPQRLDVEFVYPDGQVAWFEVGIEPQPAGATILSIDVTARKRAEESLRRERDTIQRIAESVPVGITHIDRDGRVVFANAKAEEILGLSRDAITRGVWNASPWQVMDEAGRPIPEDERPYARVRRTGLPLAGVRHVVQHPDGRRVLLSVNAQPLLREGAFDGMVASFEDVTGRASALEELRESEERFRQIAGHVEEVFWMTDPTKREMLYVSPAYDEIWGRDPAGLYANPIGWLEAIHADDRSRVQAALPSQVEGTYDVEYRIVRPDGSVRWIRDRAFPVRDAVGRVYRVVGVAEDISRQKASEDALRRSEEALRASEAQLRSFVDQAPADIAMFDRDMVCVAASGRWLGTWSRGRASVVGLSHYEVNPDLPERWKDIHRRGLAGETLHGDEDSWTQADGAVRRVRWVVQPWRDGRGAVGGIMILAEDITDQKHEREALAAERAMLRTVFDLLPDLIYVKDSDHRFVASNAACARHFGVATPDDLIGRSDADFYPPERVAEFTADERRVLEGRPFVDKKEAYLTPAGARRSLLTSKVPLIDGRGRIRGLVGTGRDVTERERAELRLKTQHTVTRVLAEASSLGEAAPRILQSVCEGAGGAFGTLWDVDRQANVLRCLALWHAEDLAADDLAAQTRAAAFPPGVGLVGRAWSGRRTVVALDLERDPGFVRAAAAARAGLRAAFALPILAKDEVIAVVDVMGSDLRAPDDDLLEMLTTVASQIAQFVDHRRAEAQFIQSQKMEAVGQLAGGIAHDFNNLLGVILAYADMARRELGEHRAVRRIDAIRKGAERAAALTQQILTFSRKQPVAVQVCDLNGIVENMEKMLRRLIGEDVRLAVVPGPELGRVRADPSQLEQVILNLAVNARDAMPTGGRLVVETSNVDVAVVPQTQFDMRPGPHVMLAVSDTGQGMTPETQARIFEPFFTTKAQGKGTGLGLAVVYGVVKQGGGGISVYSEPGRGTTFKIYLPRVEEAPSSVAPPQKQAAPRGGSETILLVEDEDALRSVVAETLRLEGYEVLEAKDPRSALVVAAQAERGIHLILTDVVLPGESGPETAAQIRGQHPEARVLLVSGYTDRLLEGQRGVEPGMPFLGKPFTSEALLLKVREVLDAAP